MKVQLFKEWTTWKYPLKICFRDKICMTMGVVQLRSSFFWGIAGWLVSNIWRKCGYLAIEMRPLRCCHIFDTTQPVTRHHIPGKWRLYDFYILNQEEGNICL
jgi:hypothetical protein